MSEFPCDKAETLAMLYMDSRDLSDKNPKEIARMYAEAHKEIVSELKMITEENKKPKQTVTY